MKERFARIIIGTIIGLILFFMGLTVGNIVKNKIEEIKKIEFSKGYSYAIEMIYVPDNKIGVKEVKKRNRNLKEKFKG